MKQGKIYTELILWLLLAAVVCYIGSAVFRALEAPMSTVQAVEYEAGSACQVSGWVVRDETVLTTPYGITVLSRHEGERVGVGQTVATGYRSADAQARQQEIEAAEAQLAQLQYARAYDYDPANAAALDREIAERFAECGRSVQRRDLGAARSLASELKGLLLRSAAGGDGVTALDSQIQALQDELAGLRSVSGAEMQTVTAPVSGWFSGTVDGYEQILGPERLGSLTVSELQTLAPASIPEGACGRLVRSSCWYFVCAVPAELLEEVAIGEAVTASFTYGSQSSIEMRVYRLGEETEGERLLVLACEDHVQDVTLLRAQTIELVFQTYSGLRVPKTALCMDSQDRPCVYILESGRAKSKAVSILFDNGESYIVALDKSDTDNLWPGDEIILNPRDIYDGKVVTGS